MSEEQVELGDLHPDNLDETVGVLHEWLDEVDSAMGVLGAFAEAMDVRESDYGAAVTSERVDQAMDTAYLKLGVVSWLKHRQALKAAFRVEPSMAAPLRGASS